MEKLYWVREYGEQTGGTEPQEVKSLYMYNTLENPIIFKFDEGKDLHTIAISANTVLHDGKNKYYIAPNSTETKTEFTYTFRPTRWIDTLYLYFNLSTKKFEITTDTITNDNVFYMGMLRGNNGAVSAYLNGYPFAYQESGFPIDWNTWDSVPTIKG